MKSFLPYFLLSLPALASLPSVGPEYQRPQLDLPAAYTGQAKVEEANLSLPLSWWKQYHDPVLDGLVERALIANQNLAAAASRVQQARALAGVTRSAYMPTLGADGRVSRDRLSRELENAAPVEESTSHQAGLAASWELDLFGRVRRLNEGARADAAAAASLLSDLQLTLEADLASNYLNLRALDRERGLVLSALELRRDTRRLIEARLRAGAATDFDLARADADLATAEAESIGLQERRAALQTAIAVLVGVNATDFRIEETLDESLKPLAVPAGLPGSLLQRRPDLQAAEAQLLSANAAIGASKAAFFPSFTLTGAAGYASADLDHLGNSSSTFWSLAPSVHLPLFEGGRNRARLQRSQAAYEEQVALYRQRVLMAVREVQDALNSSALLGQQAEAQDRAVGSARRAGTIAATRYKSGLIGYYELLEAQRSVLDAERAQAQLEARQLLANVSLIRSLGGGWRG